MHSLTTAGQATSQQCTEVFAQTKHHDSQEVLVRFCNNCVCSVKVMLMVTCAHVSHIPQILTLLSAAHSPPPPPLPVTHSQRTPFINAAAVVILCCRRPDVEEGPCHHPSAVDKALRQPRDQIGIRAGTDLPPGLQFLVPEMQAYRSLEAGRRPHMTRLLDMPLAESCPLPFPGGRSAMALHWDRDLDVTFLGFLKGQGPTGVLPHQGQVKPQTDCLHQWQDEHQQLSGSHRLPELQGTILAGTRGC